MAKQGSFTMNAMNSSVKTKPIGMISVPFWISAGSIVMSNVPTEKKRARMPTSMKALPKKVKMRNFMAEYSFRPVPQIEIRKNIGMSSSSQSRKNKMKSSAVNTPMTAVCRTSSQTKYSRTRCRTPQDANTAAMPSSPVRSTSGALRPSTARKYWTLRAESGIQSDTLSTSWNLSPSVS